MAAVCASAGTCGDLRHAKVFQAQDQKAVVAGKDQIAVIRPGWERIVRLWMVGEILLIGSIHVHHIDFVISKLPGVISGRNEVWKCRPTIAIGLESDLFAIRRPGR